MDLNRAYNRTQRAKQQRVQKNFPSNNLSLNIKKKIEDMTQEELSLLTKEQVDQLVAEQRQKYYENYLSPTIPVNSAPSAGGSLAVEAPQIGYVSNLNEPFTWTYSEGGGATIISEDLEGRTIAVDYSGFTVLNVVESANWFYASGGNFTARTFTGQNTGDGTISLNRYAFDLGNVGSTENITSGSSYSITLLLGDATLLALPNADGSTMSIGFTVVDSDNPFEVSDQTIDDIAIDFDPMGDYTEMPPWVDDTVTASPTHSISWESGAIRFNSLGDAVTVVSLDITSGIPLAGGDDVDYYFKISGITGSATNLDLFITGIQQDGGNLPGSELAYVDLSSLQNDGSYDTLVYSSGNTNAGHTRMGLKFRTHSGGGTASFLLERALCVSHRFTTVAG